MPNRRALPRLALLLALAGGAANAAPLSLTPLELPGQAQGSVLALDNGFVVSWIDREADAAALRFAELDRDGAPLQTGEIARGSGWFVNWADFPALTAADNGDWVGFVLVKSDPAKPYAYDVLTTRSADRGATWSPLQVLHDDGTPTEHGFVSLLPDGGDRVLAVWLDGRHAAGHDGHDHESAHTALHSAVLTRDGIVERRELDELTCDCCRTAALRTPEGPLVVYRDRTPGEVRDIQAVHRAAEGWSSPEPVSVDHWVMPGCPVNGPAITMLGTAPLVAWPTLADGTMQLRLARRDGHGWRRLAELDRGEDLAGRVDLAAWGEDGALATWLAAAADGRTALLLARLDGDGRVVERQVVSELPAGRSTGMPRLAARNGRALLVWTDPRPDGPRLAGVLVRDASTAGD